MIKEIFGFLFRFSGFSFFIREIICRKRVTIIVYHNPDPEKFEGHLKFLSYRYNFISLGILVNAIKNKDWSDIPPKPLVITIDDGHKNNYKLLKHFCQVLELIKPKMRQKSIDVVRTYVLICQCLD